MNEEGFIQGDLQGEDTIDDAPDLDAAGKRGAAS